MVLVTRGRDTGSGRGPLDAVAFAEASPVPEGPEAMEDLYATPIPEV